ncbi:MAG: hypothetical protein ACE366_01805 [Bradymonadia bacterium]
MGLFGKLKGMKNAITGGGAEVTVEVGEAQLGGVAPVRVTALAKADFNIQRVYLLVQCNEGALVHDVDVARNGQLYRETVEGEVCTCNLEIDIAEGGSLSEGETYTWESDFELPAEGLPTLAGQTIRNTWIIRAGLDARGNDPDSGWVEFVVYP